MVSHAGAVPGGRLADVAHATVWDAPCGVPTRHARREDPRAPHQQGHRPHHPPRPHRVRRGQRRSAYDGAPGGLGSRAGLRPGYGPWPWYASPCAHGHGAGAASRRAARRPDGAHPDPAARCCEEGRRHEGADEEGPGEPGPAQVGPHPVDARRRRGDRCGAGGVGARCGGPGACDEGRREEGARHEGCSEEGPCEEDQQPRRRPPSRPPSWLPPWGSARPRSPRSRSSGDTRRIVRGDRTRATSDPDRR